MDDAIRRRLGGGTEPSDEPTEEASGINNLGAQMVGGLTGVSALHASGWVPPADLEWQDEQDNWQITPTVQEEASGTGIDARTLAIGTGVFLLAALPRLFVIFFVTDPQNPGLGWYGDTFHHWQIAYLSMEIGFEEGFLRLWDFKGMEYFWGLLHPLILAGLFSITGSVDILIPRMVSLVSGSLAVVFLFVLARRYFGTQVAVAAALLAALNPVGIFSDASGMQEPLGIMLLLGGLLLWPKRPFATGAIWALAGMVRAEYWVIGAGLIFAAFLVEKGSIRKIGLAIGWGVPSLLYMKYMAGYTGNPIYPIYWNYMGNAAGAWMEDIPLDATKLAVQWGFRIVAILCVIGFRKLWKSKPRHSLLYLLGLGNVLLVSIMLGFSAYVRGFLPRFFVDRIFEWPYAFLGLVIAVLLIREVSPRIGKSMGPAAAWTGVVGVLAVSQLAWPVIWRYFEPGRLLYEGEFSTATAIAENYEGGVISIPEDRPWQTYWLVNEFDLDARSIEGQMYDPFAYIEGDPFARWDESSETIRNWLDTQDIKLLVFYTGKWNYEEMIRREPGWFNYVSTANQGTVQIYQVVGQ